MLPEVTTPAFLMQYFLYSIVVSVGRFVVNDWMATSALHKKLEGEKLKILAFSQAKQEALGTS